MKSRISFLLLIMCSAGPYVRRSFYLSEPSGKLEVAKHPLVLEAPTGPQPQNLDFSKAQQQAADLNELARIGQIEVDQAAQSKLPKDLPEKLKQIERISKKLRAELVP